MRCQPLPGVAMAMLLLAGCGAPRAYLGIDLTARPVDGSALALQHAARLAASGSKPAMLAVGAHFEAVGDLDRACLAYRAAGATTGGTIYVWSPPVTLGGAGRVIPITTPVSPGLRSGTERRAVVAYRATDAEKARSACLRDP